MYELLQDVNTEFRQGDTVFKFLNFDNGNAYSLYRVTGVDCISITKDPTGAGDQWVAVPVDVLREVT